MLIDTAGRYVQQESQPEVDAAEWLGFLDLLKKHRGRRALNGVIVALPVDVARRGRRGDPRAWPRDPQAPGRAQRAARDPPAGLSAADQGRPDQGLRAELRRPRRPPSASRSGARPSRPASASTPARSAASSPRWSRGSRRRVGAAHGGRGGRWPTRAEIFRFPAQVASLDAPLQLLVETVFGESRYEESAWLRGFYLTSATQEGTPIDRLVGALASSFGLPAAPRHAAPRVEQRSFFLRRLLTDVIFSEAGLGTLDPQAEQRRALDLARRGGRRCRACWCSATLAFTVSYLANRGAVAAQAGEFDRLRGAAGAGRRPPGAGRAAPTSTWRSTRSTEVAERPRAAARRPSPASSAPRPRPEIAAAQDDAYDHALRNILEPRMVALLEATMWRQIRDPDFLLGALKTYRMMTGLSQMDPDFAEDWWTNGLPEFAATPPFPTEAAQAHQLAAIDRMPLRRELHRAGRRAGRRGAAERLLDPAAARAYDALLADPAATALPDWVPANFAGPNGAKVFTRRSGKTLRVGIDGHLHLRRLPRRRARRGWRTSRRRPALDRAVFAGGCAESAETSVDGARRGHAQALLRRLHRPVGRLAARHDAGAADRPRRPPARTSRTCRAPIRR